MHEIDKIIDKYDLNLVLDVDIDDTDILKTIKTVIEKSYNINNKNQILKSIKSNLKELYHNQLLEEKKDFKKLIRNKINNALALTQTDRKYITSRLNSVTTDLNIDTKSKDIYIELYPYQEFDYYESRDVGKWLFETSSKTLTKEILENAPHWVLPVIKDQNYDIEFMNELFEEAKYDIQHSYFVILAKLSIEDIIDLYQGNYTARKGLTANLVNLHDFMGGGFDIELKNNMLIKESMIVWSHIDKTLSRIFGDNDYLYYE